MARPEDRTPLEEAVARVGDRWSLLIVEAMLGGPKRFIDLVEDLPGIAPNVLSQRLRHLEQQGVVLARPYQQRPVRLIYELSGGGKELAGALRLLAHWGARRSDAAETPRHAACGTPLETRWYCPTCARTVDDPEEADVRYL